MKKTLFALLLVSILFLTGCDDITEEVPENPMLEVVGDLDITIGLNDEYVDQGVNVIGDYDLDITTDNQVDSSTYGIGRGAGNLNTELLLDIQLIIMGKRFLLFEKLELFLVLKKILIFS